MSKENLKFLQAPKGSVVIYKENGLPSLKVKVEKETVWLTQKQIAELFQKEPSTINEHIKNIYKEGELKEGASVRKFRIVQKEGQRQVARDVDFYNLDMIIAVGYRVNSKRGTQFRVWANKILRDYLVKGFTLNQKLLREKQQGRVSELERIVVFLKQVIEKRVLETDEAQGLLRVITDYAQSWALLEKYDQKKLILVGAKSSKAQVFSYEQAKSFIDGLRKNLLLKKEASQFFGAEKEDGLRAILENINQEISGKPGYPTIEEKAAQLLYSIIKDKVFIDGNKRIASFLFVLFLARNNCLVNKKGERKINDSALTALSLLVSESSVQEKELILALIVNLLSGK